MKRHAINPRIYIYCNGGVGEPVYFKEFKDHLRSRTITISYNRFKGNSPWDLIEKVVAEKNALTSRGRFVDEDGDQCWCVFDVDEFWNQNPAKFKVATKLARENDIRLAWSNECFELWYLLHFQSLQTGIPRNDYHTKLKTHFRRLGGKPYTKNCSVFDRILDKQAEAIKNAKQIFQINKVENNPSTAVFKLVEEINRIFGAE
ncbi:MAG: RloB family protein [Patescibacteria group bacterium]